MTKQNDDYRQRIETVVDQLKSISLNQQGDCQNVEKILQTTALSSLQLSEQIHQDMLQNPVLNTVQISQIIGKLNVYCVELQSESSMVKNQQLISQVSQVQQILECQKQIFMKIQKKNSHKRSLLISTSICALLLSVGFVVFQVLRK